AYANPYPAMTSSISLKEAPRAKRMEGTPMLAMKKSMTPRRGPTRIMAKAIHLFTGAFTSFAVARGCRLDETAGFNRLRESTEPLESERTVPETVERFMRLQNIAARSDKKNSLFC